MAINIIFFISRFLSVLSEVLISPYAQNDTISRRPTQFRIFLHAS